MKKNIKVYYMTQHTNVDSQMFEESKHIEHSTFANDTANYFPMNDETMNFHQKNLVKPGHIPEQLVPWTVYYYSLNELIISDSPFTLPYLFESAVRKTKFVSYTW